MLAISFTIIRVKQCSFIFQVSVEPLPYTWLCDIFQGHKEMNDMVTWTMQAYANSIPLAFGRVVPGTDQPFAKTPAADSPCASLLVSDPKFQAVNLGETFRIQIPRVPGWLSRLNVRLRLRSWSHGLWVRAPRRALCWQLGAWSLLQILCLPLALPPFPIHALSLCLKNK